MLVVVSVLLATAQGSLTEEERASMADMIPCPFIAAEVKYGRLTPENGMYTRDQANDVLKVYMTDVFGDTIRGKLGLSAFRTGLMTAVFGVSGKEGPMPPQTVEWLHKTHTGIRLANIVADPDTWKKPCNHVNHLGNWSMDPSCGEPGPRPEMFDYYAHIMGKGPNDKWSKEDFADVCKQGEHALYDAGKAHPKGGIGGPFGDDVSTCEGVFAGSVSVFGELTTVEWKAFLINLTYPAGYVPGEVSSAAVLSAFSLASWATIITIYFQAQ